jgi:iron(III) transport system substrate-binding protein
MMRTKLALAALAALVLATVPARAQLVIDGEKISEASTFDAAKKEGSLTAYGIYPVEQMTAILKAFEADTGIKTEFIRLPTPNLFNRVNTEFAAGKLEADYLDIADQTLINQLVEKGIYAPHKVPTFDHIPATLKEKDGRYYTVLRIISTAIVANMSRVKEADVPKKLEDILDPKWKGIIGITNINAGGSAFTMDAFLRERLGQDYGKRLAALNPKIYPFIQPLITDVTRGEIALAVGAISEPILAQMKAGAPLKMVLTPEGIGSFPTVAGVTSTAKHPNAAALLIDWMTSKRGGKVIVKGGAYALNPDAGSPMSEFVTYPPPDKVWNIDPVKWIAERENRMNEWRQTFGVN